MIAYEGTMKSILKSLKTTLLDYRNTVDGEFLSQIKTYKIGILGQMTTFPALVIVPDSEKILRWYSGRKAMVERTFYVGVFHKGANFAAADAKVGEILERVCNLWQMSRTLKTKATGKEEAFDLQVGSMDLNATSEGTVLLASTTITTKSIEQFAFPEYTVNSVDDPSSVELIELVQSRILAQRENYLATTRSVLHGAINDTTAINFPAIIFRETTEDREKRFWSGQNKVVRSLIFNVCNKCIPDDSLIYELIDVVEGLKKTLMVNERWTGLAEDSAITGIEYLQDTLKGSLIYVAQLSYEITSKRKTVFVGE